MKILFVISDLAKGGKERRLIELLTYLRNNTIFTLHVILSRGIINFDEFYKLNISYTILNTSSRNNILKMSLRIFQVCNTYKPNIIHTWGSSSAFLSILSILFFRIPHVNGQITDSPSNIKIISKLKFINCINFYFSDLILANSKAGLKSYGQENNKKSKVIYNGIELSRFQIKENRDEIKKRNHIFTRYCVVMLASFSDMKDYKRFIDIASEMQQRRGDVTFLAIGDGKNFYNCAKYSEKLKINNIKFLGERDDVEVLLNACDIGILLSVHGEGTSNSILEYMAMGLPVIANKKGGTVELLDHMKNGFLIDKESNHEICNIIDDLLNNPKKRKKLGLNGKTKIYKYYSIDYMSQEFINYYRELCR